MDEKEFGFWKMRRSGTSNICYPHDNYHRVLCYKNLQSKSEIKDDEKKDAKHHIIGQCTLRVTSKAIPKQRNLIGVFPGKVSQDPTLLLKIYI
jgi:hypothetical protein